MQEKRRYPRIRMIEKVYVKDPKGVKKTQDIDLSVNGIGIIIDKKLNVGDIVELEFKFPDIPNKCKVKAKVVWQKKVKEGYNTGLEFEQLHLTVKG